MPDMTRGVPEAAKLILPLWQFFADYNACAPVPPGMRRARGVMRSHERILHQLARGTGPFSL
jgi:hypothetical protein